MLASWKLDPYTVMRLNSGRRGDDVLKGGGGGHLACSSHKPLTSSYSSVTKRLQAGQDQGFRIVCPAKYYFESFPLYRLNYMPERKPHRTGLLLTLEGGDFGAMSVTERSCAAPISKV